MRRLSVAEPVELLATLAADGNDERRPVCALATLDGELFVARCGSLLIDVFDVTTFQLRRRVSVPGVHRPLRHVVAGAEGANSIR